LAAARGNRANLRCRAYTYYEPVRIRPRSGRVSRSSRAIHEAEVRPGFPSAQGNRPPYWVEGRSLPPRVRVRGKGRLHDSALARLQLVRGRNPPGRGNALQVSSAPGERVSDRSEQGSDRGAQEGEDSLSELPEQPDLSHRSERVPRGDGSAVQGTRYPADV